MMVTRLGFCKDSTDKDNRNYCEFQPGFAEHRHCDGEDFIHLGWQEVKTTVKNVGKNYSIRTATNDGLDGRLADGGIECRIFDWVRACACTPPASSTGCPL